MIIKRDKIKYLRNFFIFLDTIFIRVIILIGIQKLLLFDNLNLLDPDFLFLIFGCILFAIFIEFLYIFINYFIKLEHKYDKLKNKLNESRTLNEYLIDEREKIKEILNIKSDDIIENLNNNNSIFFEILILFYFIYYSIIFYYINTYLLYS